MVEEVSSRSMTPMAQAARRLQAFWCEPAATRRLAVIAFVLGALVMLAYRPWRQFEAGDTAVYDYIAQSILRGQMPYRDVVDIKGPLGPYLSAAAIAAGRAVGLRDILAVRFFHLLMVGLLSAVTYLVGESYLRNRLAALIAFLIPLLPEHFALMTITGTQPKLPMILFGMLSLLLIARDKPFWAGLCSMLACLCWQPGLMFTGTAVLICSRYLTSWRDGRALKVMAGALIPLAIVLAYFYARGALADLWAWAITYNFSVFGPEAKSGLSQAITRLWQIIIRVFRYDRPLVILSLLGLLMFVGTRLRDKLKGRAALAAPDLFRDAAAIPALVYLAFCMINFQASADLIPFFPFIGLFAGWFFVEAGRLAATIATRWLKRGPRLWQREGLIPAVAACAILLVLTARVATYRIEGRTLQDQDEEFKTLAALLAPDDKIFVHGTVEILVLLNRPNLNPYVLLDWDADNFAGSRHAGGWEAIMDEMKAQAPKLVAITRLRAVTHRADFEQWVEQDYDKLELFKYDRVYIKKGDK
ncbi:MAG TPA: DolP-mannose mannosyltransferase [Blastocatellia bacterium]|nr:DolP-mannose mannosyltransferase [Blastocatellia bacterium]